ncbi:MAG TPA: hypothetical protein VJ386_12115 [Candidatus Deferrimicrobiaceae bacterium]|nr:hypothetical protein [Candidatus Deferrimicrobiaceae bacterium]
MRLDVSALGLVPLRLEKREVWDPDKHFWGEEGEPIAGSHAVLSFPRAENGC